MSMPSKRPGFPAHLLSSEAMISACRERDFAQVFKLAKRAGMYNATISSLVHLTQSRVGEIASGKHKIVKMDVIERVADGLRIPGHMLGLARREWEGPEPATPARQEGGFPHAPADPVLSLPGPDLDSILAVAAGPKLSPSTVRALHSSIEDYWRRDDEHGGETLRPAVVGQLRYAVELIKEAGKGEYRRTSTGSPPSWRG
ncbi:hypothetical protein [Streptomyces sp. NPDC001678]|uniref:hypothetical protein n=1 Tax=Streptomyces sp. NPDC001678 TaxID=3364599 RepID=UPI0036959C5D